MLSLCFNITIEQTSIKFMTDGVLLKEIEKVINYMMNLKMYIDKN